MASFCHVFLSLTLHVVTVLIQTPPSTFPFLELGISFM